MKQMMIMAYDIRCAIWSYSAPACVHTLLHKILRCKIRQIRLQMLDRVTILHDNTRPHNHPPYSPDLSPLDYNRFPKLKELLRGLDFRDLSELSSAMTQEIRWLNSYTKKAARTLVNVYFV